MCAKQRSTLKREVTVRLRLLITNVVLIHFHKLPCDQNREWDCRSLSSKDYRSSVNSDSPTLSVYVSDMFRDPQKTQYILQLVSADKLKKLPWYRWGTQEQNVAHGVKVLVKATLCGDQADNELDRVQRERQFIDLRLTKLVWQVSSVDHCFIQFSCS